MNCTWLRLSPYSRLVARARARHPPRYGPTLAQVKQSLYTFYMLGGLEAHVCLGLDMIDYTEAEKLLSNCRIMVDGKWVGRSGNDLNVPENVNVQKGNPKGEGHDTATDDLQPKPLQASVVLPMFPALCHDHVYPFCHKCLPAELLAYTILDDAVSVPPEQLAVKQVNDLVASMGRVAVECKAEVGTGQPPPVVSSSKYTVEPGGGVKMPNVVHAPRDHPFSFIDSTLPGGVAKLLEFHELEEDKDHGWHYGNHPAFRPDQKTNLASMLVEHKHCFAYSMNDLPGYHGKMPPMRIDLQHDKPIFQNPRRLSERERKILDEHYPELLTANVIAPCETTFYAVNSVVVPKKGPTGEWTGARVCQDYRPINRVTVHDRYPLHLPEELWGRVAEAKASIFSKIDLRSGFFQLPLHKEHCNITAFWWGNRLYDYLRVPFGLKNAPAHFQRVMDHELARFRDFCCVYIDDLLIFSSTPDEHIKHVEQVLDQLHSVGLRAHPAKSVFASPVVEYLGHNVSMHGLSPHKAKVAAIEALPCPRNISELRAVLGFLNYYRAYVPNFSAISQPLNGLLKKDVPWNWTPECQQALDALKAELMVGGKVLRPLDDSRPILLHTDWSVKGMGAVLGQVDEEGNEYMVACVSRSLNKHEKNYVSFQGEMLGVVWAVKTLRHYLHGRPFTLVTDHAPITWLMSNPNLQGQHARWAMVLQEFEFTIQHRPGVKHQNADPLSRFPQESAVDCTDARLDEDLPLAACCMAALRLTGLACGMAECSAVMLDVPCMSALLEHEFSVWHQDIFEAWESEVVVEDRARLRKCANSWVSVAYEQLMRARPMRPSSLNVGILPSIPEMSLPVAIDTSIVANAFFQAADNEGVVLMELFGGMCAGLEMCLKMGIRVKKYLYCDISPHAQAIADYRVIQLHDQHPTLLPLAALRGYREVLPQEVREFNFDVLREAGAECGDQWLVVAGWECQDLSTAGKGAGIDGPRSSTFYPLKDVLAMLQNLQRARPPAYLLENVCAQYNYKHPLVRQDFERVCAAIGQPVPLDAAQFGSYAHRLRNFWTNLADTHLIDIVASGVERHPDLFVTDILAPHRVPREVTDHDNPPFYPCNVPGEPRRAFPTFVSTICSYAFRDGGPGIIRDASTGHEVEPAPDERELAMGYAAGSTAAPGIPWEVRHVVTGRAMDLNCLSSLMAITRSLLPFAPRSVVALPAMPVMPPISEAAMALSYGPGYSLLKKDGWRHGSGLGSNSTGIRTPLHIYHITEFPDHAGDPPEDEASAVPVASATPVPQAGGTSDQNPDGQLPGSEMAEEFFIFTALDRSAEVEDDGIPADLKDVSGSGRTEAVYEAWEDEHLISYLKSGTPHESWTPKECKRVKWRARQYIWRSGSLSRIMRDGTSRLVPRPADRVGLVQRTHELNGHYGIRRTLHMLAGTHWWRGIAADVAYMIKRCEACSQANAVANVKSPVLQPLPIRGLMYRWGVDLCGPFDPPSSRGHKYVMIAVEHFSKWLEAVPIPDKKASTVAYAFGSRVLSRFGGCAEVVTDQGSEFEGEFDELLFRCMIDHRHTSAGRPQADGLAERAVQTIKRSLRKFCASKANKGEWDMHVAWAVLGYNCSVQSSTKYSPYELLFGHKPVIPPAVMPRMEPPLLLTDDNELAKQLQRRAEAMQHHLTIAGNNLAVAQHRDTLRYALVRGGGWQPGAHKFRVGDYVYLKRVSKDNTLSMPVKSTILRVHQVKPSGVLRLIGGCGSIMDVHAENCAPCHLLDIDPSIDLELRAVSKHASCEVCGLMHDEDVLLACDQPGCNKLYHIYCLRPQLTEIPSGAWVCPHCVRSGASAASLTVEAGGKRRSTPERYQPLDRVALLEQEESQRLDGTRRCVMELDTRGASVKDCATVRYLGPAYYPQGFELEFDSGKKERVGLRRVKQMDVEPLAAPVSLSSIALEADSLPGHWDLSVHANMLHALQILMPGPRKVAHVTSLCKHVPDGEKFKSVNGVPECVPITEPEIAVLLEYVDLSLITSIADVWSGTGTIPRYFQRMGHTVVANDICERYPAEFHEDALQPSLYRRLKAKGLCDAIVTSPWFKMADLAAPLAAEFCDRLACLHLPGTFIVDAPEARAVWLAQLKAEGRLFTVLSLPPGPVGHRCIWLCVFKNRALRDAMVRPGRLRSRYLTLD